MRIPLFCWILFSLGSIVAADVKLDQRPAKSGEWGYRPAHDDVVSINPPAFSWRPQQKMVRWEIECGKGTDFKSIEYRASEIDLNVHCPPKPFTPGRYQWRYRGVTKHGGKTNWSRSRTFTIPDEAAKMPLPARDDLLARIPASHPRLFIRPEDVPSLRKLAQGQLKDSFADLVSQSDRLLAHPPPTAEPPKYGAGIVVKSDEWGKIWWGNRVYTIRALDGAATLAFTHLIGGEEKYAQLAKRILMDCAKWDPQGSTGYLYNDEAGMPYAYYFARTYTFLYDQLSLKEREICRRVMKIRGDEMYHHLFPRHLWKPYSSHSNRAWHFLGEIGIALHGEVEGADDWVWFATNVFRNVYPVWSDNEGGWHEGVNYWHGYVGRFTWWTDVMRSALRMDAFKKPYFSKIGYYPMYLMPPGTEGGGFGDLNVRVSAKKLVPLVSQLATQAGNGHWQWYVDQMGGPSSGDGYVGFARGALPSVEPIAPDDLPTSRLFRGIGQAALNTSLRDAKDNVQILFKSSPFGTQSHGYEANNSFLLRAYGQRLLIRSGYRDSYGSDHHQRWMWSTRSVNNITIDGQGQIPHSPSALGRISFFRTTPAIDVVVGESASAYQNKSGDPLLDRYTRAIMFVKPDLIIVYDRLSARDPSTFQYWLHATNEFAVTDQRSIDLRVKHVGCTVSLLAPSDLQFSQTNEYSPNPRPRIKLREWHLTATTPTKTKTVEFVAVYRPYRDGNKPQGKVTLTTIDGGYLLKAQQSGGQVIALLPRDDNAHLSAESMVTTGALLIECRKDDGSVTATLRTGR